MARGDMRAGVIAMDRKEDVRVRTRGSIHRHRMNRLRDSNVTVHVARTVTFTAGTRSFAGFRWEREVVVIVRWMEELMHGGKRLRLVGAVGLGLWERQDAL